MAVASNVPTTLSNDQSSKQSLGVNHNQHDHPLLLVGVGCEPATSRSAYRASTTTQIVI